MVSFKELAAEESFDPNSIAPGTPFTQAAFYGAWQGVRRVRRFVGEEEGSPVIYFQIIRYPLSGARYYLYIPYGPIFANYSDELLGALREKLLEIAKEESAVFVRIDPTPAPTRSLDAWFRKAPHYTYHSSYFQPRAEWALDLVLSEDALMAEMHEKHRYSIRTAEKRGVTAEIVTSNFEKYLDQFIGLMGATSERNAFSLHPKEYYERIFKELPNIKDAYLAVAKHEEETLSIGIFLPFGGVVNYVFAGSASDDRNRMPSYLALWEAIRHAKAIGATTFNFGGISTDEDPHSGWAGLTRFKKRFGGSVVRHGDFYDLVIDSVWYRLYLLRKFLKSLF